MRLRLAISTAPDLSGSGRVDMLMRPVALARAAVASGASGETETRHVSDTWKCGSLDYIFTHPPEDGKEKEKEKGMCVPSCAVYGGTTHEAQQHGYIGLHCQEAWVQGNGPR